MHRFHKFVHLVGFTAKKFVTMHGHMNVKNKSQYTLHVKCHVKCSSPYTKYVERFSRTTAVRSYIVANVCTHNPDNMNNYEPVTEEAHYCMLLLKQYGLKLVKSCNLEFLRFQFFNFFF
jgi:hypothetical protein